MAGADPGNVRLSYATDAVNAITVRCTKFATSFEVVGTESHAREVRAYYPHQRSLGRFMIEVKFLTYREYKLFMNFLRSYAKSWLHPPTDKAYYSPGILVQLARGKYNETWTGVPIAGITDGDHVGNIAYPSQIVFQAIRDPLDPTMFTGNDDVKGTSYYEFGDNYDGGNEDDTTKFFYPFSKGSEDIRTQAADIYGITVVGDTRTNYTDPLPGPGGR